MNVQITKKTIILFIILFGAIAIFGPASLVQAQAWTKTLDSRHNQFVEHPGGKISITSCQEDDLHPIAAITYDANGNKTGEIAQPFWSCRMGGGRNTKASGPDGIIYGVRDNIDIPHRPQPTFAVEAYQNGSQLWSHTFQYHHKCWGSEPYLSRMKTGAGGNLYLNFHRGEGWCQEDQGLETTERIAALAADGSTIYHKENPLGTRWGSWAYHDQGFMVINGYSRDVQLNFFDTQGDIIADEVIVEGTHGGPIGEAEQIPRFNVSSEAVFHVAQGVWNDCQQIVQATKDGIQKTIDLPACGQVRNSTAGPWGTSWMVQVHDSPEESRHKIVNMDNNGQVLSTLDLPAQFRGARDEYPQVRGDVNGNLIIWQRYTVETVDGVHVPDAKVMVMNPADGNITHQFDTKNFDTDPNTGFLLDGRWDAGIKITDDRIYLMGDQCRNIAPMYYLPLCTDKESWQLHAIEAPGVGVEASAART